MEIGTIKIARKFNLGNYEMIDIEVSFIFPSGTEANNTIQEFNKSINKILEDLKTASIVKQ